MQPINWTRVLTGGLIAGLVINFSEFVMNAIVLKNDWAQAMKALNKSGDFSVNQIVIFNIIGFLLGIAGVWLYAAIRPRLGAGLMTALTAAVAVWVIGNLLPNMGFIAMDLFPVNLMYIGTGGGLVETLVAIALGAKMYREETAPTGARSAATTR